MKKVFYLKKSIISENDLIDPSSLIGKQYIFDNFYLIKILSLNDGVFTVKMDMGNHNQIDRISISDFINHIQNGNMVQKTDIEIFDFESFEDYYDKATSFLLKNYKISIDTIIFDWESEFQNLTPIEIACKIALGILRK